MVHPAAFIASLLAAAVAVVADECYTTTNADTLTLTRGEGSFHGSIDIWGANCVGVEWQLQFNNNDQYNEQECTFDKNGATRLNLTVSDATYPFSCKAVDLATLDSGYFNLIYLGVNWEYNSYAYVYEGNFN
ncbi:hypothetical protein EXIGLDRAFT_725675 [Exidia glandulosa HHB12029]|uniref:Uncharacterized protein n=1 Tax=Exidia glandulosa HHB12029 TaxID=1314781 RepID=A0A165Q7W2_EXIGL|nr:hypothetical protein EXIGLDRAFT_725675 [Exidia glandulosa HHB12029]